MRAPAIRFYDVPPETNDFGEEALRGLSARPKSIPPKFFYDRRGSELFEAICRLPEYYPTRTEIGILKDCVEEVVRLAGPGCTLVELGSGASRKVRLLLERRRPRAYVGVDISRDFLLQVMRRLAQDYPWLEVHAAYNDSQGVTAAFNLNLLRRLRRELGARLSTSTPSATRRSMTRNGAVSKCIW